MFVVIVYYLAYTISCFDHIIKNVAQLLQNGSVIHGQRLFTLFILFTENVD